MRYNFITIEGNIGAGKTSLATRITEENNGKLILEAFADNPFLPKFCANPKQFAFPLELFFMAERYQQIQQHIAERELFQQFTITDYLFIKSLIFAQVTLLEDEYKLYQRLFNIMNPTLPQPQLLLYLHCPVDKLLNNIKKRGRDYEQSITGEYLTSIQEKYFDYFRQQKQMRILILDTTHVDFVHNDAHYQRIVELMNEDIDAGLHFVEL